MKIKLMTFLHKHQIYKNLKKITIYNKNKKLMEKHFKIKESTAVTILQYLGTRPYIEVLELIQGLQGIVPIEEVSEPTQTTEE